MHWLHKPSGVACVLGLLAAAACTRGGAELPGHGTSWTLPPDDEIRAVLAERVEANGVGIVVGVVDSRGRRVFTAGRSGADNDRPLDGGTVFQLGSVTKPITTLLLADMVQRGQVWLDDPAARYLPSGVSLPQIGRPITLRDLATHMSGLPSMPTNVDLHGLPDPIAAYSVDDLWTFLSGFRPDRAPGVEYEYSNLGVSLLGRLLALRAASEYEALVTERVLQPLDMTSTSITLSPDQQARLAPGHGPYRVPVDTWEMVTLQASGSLRSTANDMLNLLEAYLGYRDAPLRPAMELQLAPGDAGSRALGWGVLEDGTVRHSGGKAGYRSGVAFHPETGIGAVVLANSRTYDAVPMDLAYYLVTGEPLPPPQLAPEPKPEIRMNAAEFASFAGVYQLESGGRIEVARNGAHLVMQYENGAIWEFAPTGRAEFFLTSGDDDVIFDVDGDGVVRGLTRYGDGKVEGSGEYARRIGAN